MALEGKETENLDQQREELIRGYARLKYQQACMLPHGPIAGRRLQLASPNLSAQEVDSAIIANLEDIGRRAGTDVLMQTPAVALEQFVIMAISRNDDAAGMLKSLVNSFILAYLTPEYSSQAFAHLQGLEDLRKQIADQRAPAGSGRH